MKVFAYTHPTVTGPDDERFSAVIVAYNRGQAVKILAKELKSRGLQLDDNPVMEIDVEGEKRGKLHVLGPQDGIRHPL